jgi:hypothetical protein
VEFRIITGNELIQIGLSVSAFDPVIARFENWKVIVNWPCLSACNFAVSSLIFADRLSTWPIATDRSRFASLSSFVKDCSRSSRSLTFSCQSRLSWDNNLILASNSCCSATRSSFRNSRIKFSCCSISNADADRSIFLALPSDFPRTGWASWRACSERSFWRL